MNMRPTRDVSFLKKRIAKKKRGRDEGGENRSKKMLKYITTMINIEGNEKIIFELEN